MNGCEFTKEYQGDTIEIIDLVVGQLIKLGYVLKKRETKYIHLKFDGQWYASSAIRQPHYLYITPQTNRLYFEFTLGDVASHWSQHDRQEIEERIEAAMTPQPPLEIIDGGPFRDPAPVSEVVNGKIRCPHCDTLSPTTLVACVGCGSTRFYSR